MVDIAGGLPALTRKRGYIIDDDDVEPAINWRNKNKKYVELSMISINKGTEKQG